MPVVVEHPEEAITVVRLQDPPVRNAVSVEMAERLAEIFEGLSRTTDVSVVVVTGTDPPFCAGIDMRDIAAGRRVPLHFLQRLSHIPVPTIAAVNGVAATGGLELALACDIRIGSERARFVDKHAQLGLLPGGGMSARLPRAVGASRALEMSLTGRTVDSEEALRIGLLDAMVPHGRLVEATLEKARAVAGIKRELLQRVVPLYRSSPHGTLDEALARERAAADEWRERREAGSLMERFKESRES